MALFVVFMLTGVVGTLLIWPKTEPTGTPWFWVQLLVLPALAWASVFGLRLHYYDDEVARLKAMDETLQEDGEKAVRFASEPLAVLGFAYLCGAGTSDVAGKLAHGETELVAKTSFEGSNGKRYTSLPLIDNEDGMGRYGPCFEKLLNRIGPTIAALPRDLGLDVRLQLPEDDQREVHLETWRLSLSKAELCSAKTTLLSMDQGLMALDEWLDIKGGPSLEKFSLFVSVQLHDAPPENSAESAVALLLGWAPLAERRGLQPVAMLHRPLEIDTSVLNDGIRLSLLWGKATPAKVNDLWQAGLLGTDKGALLQTASDAKLSISQTAELSGVHDIDTALGGPGICAGWLAAALAIEHAGQTGAPQLIAWREGSLRLAIAQPVAQKKEAESNA
ncbi:conserved hypothetical protein [Burkholderia diffusa]|uniref:hypothetical protein n=1 Tax=Burkholderia diffusa TaxID=488732 RepID=UPI001CAB146E|nr:hypothetical protein [Burkholderia diffusa]CAG9258354.1 conserved hypothetical protein [Burkholderia diffusa]